MFSIPCLVEPTPSPSSTPLPPHDPPPVSQFHVPPQKTKTLKHITYTYICPNQRWDTHTHTQGVKYVKSGMNPVSLREGIQRASKMVCDKIPELARKVESVADLVNIATVSTGGETEMARTIAAVFERVGMDAKVWCVYLFVYLSRCVCGCCLS